MKKEGDGAVVEALQINFLRIKDFILRDLTSDMSALLFFLRWAT